MAFIIEHPEGWRFQVVDASIRGDLCYHNRKGWFWHKLDSDNAIDELSIAGPFADWQSAHANAMACSYCNNSGWLYGDPELGNCGCGIKPNAGA